MPRENRKRGKKHKKPTQEVQNERHHAVSDNAEPEQTQEPGPSSWIRQRPTADEARESEVNSDAPFGYVDPDVKAYFRTVDEKLREWQDVREEGYRDDADDEHDASSSDEGVSVLTSCVIVPRQR